jgi:thioesterase domain-containing protein
MGSLTLLCAEETTHNHAAVWDHLVGHPINNIIVSGNHHSMMQEPHISSVVACLQHSLDRAQQEMDRKNCSEYHPSVD